MIVRHDPRIHEVGLWPLLIAAAPILVRVGIELGIYFTQKAALDRAAARANDDAATYGLEDPDEIAPWGLRAAYRTQHAYLAAAAPQIMKGAAWTPAKRAAILAALQTWRQWIDDPAATVGELVVASGSLWTALGNAAEWSNKPVASTDPAVQKFDFTNQPQTITAWGPFLAVLLGAGAIGLAVYIWRK